MSHIVLEAKPRKREEKNSFIRASHNIPVVVYGPKSKNQSLTVNVKAFSKAYEAAGDSTLIDLKIGGADPVKALVHEVQHNPRNGEVIHVDFYQIDMNKKLTVDVHLHIINTEPAEKSTGGEIIHGLDALPVECLPKDLIKEIEIDASEYLHALGDVMHAEDVKLPAGLELAGDPSSPIVSIQEIKKRTEAEEIAASESEKEKIKAESEGEEGEGKKEGEESASDDKAGGNEKNEEKK